MKILSFCICFFIILTTLCSISYLYLIIWHSLQPYRKIYFPPLPKNIIPNLDTIPTTIPSTNAENDKNREIRHYKSQLMVKLRRAEMQASSVLFQSQFSNNTYNVNYKGRKGFRFPSRYLLCDVPVKFITSKFFFPLIKPVVLTRIDKTFQKWKGKSCALVSNSGALLKSGLGKDIDLNDVVMRFNNAPTKNYESDVGRKTHIRILNSQLVRNPSFNLTASDLYQYLTNIVWDASNYDLNLEKWHGKESNFFSLFQRAKQEMFKSSLYLLHPEVLWSTWKILQSTTYSTLLKNPPSSGFIGLTLLMQFCSKITLYEYVPSVRLTQQCHYYDNTSNYGCTFGNWHPLATEKLFVLALNEASDYDSVMKGKVTITGCDWTQK